MLFYLMVPTLAALVISYRHPKYGLRYLLLVTPPYYLLAAYPIPPRLVASVEQPVSRSMVAEILNEIVAHHRRVWLILWQERLADPARLVLNELVANTLRLGGGPSSTAQPCSSSLWKTNHISPLSRRFNTSSLLISPTTCSW